MKTDQQSINIDCLHNNSKVEMRYQQKALCHYLEGWDIVGVSCLREREREREREEGRGGGRERERERMRERGDKIMTRNRHLV